MLKKFLEKVFKCPHKNALLYSNEGYCPDCGCFVRKSYYIVRCKCCGIKRLAKKRFDEIAPQEKFCTNCGEFEFVVEKCEKLNLVDINYAIEVKEAAEEFGKSEKIEVWIENETFQKKVDENGDNYAADGTVSLPVLSAKFLLPKIV